MRFTQVAQVMPSTGSTISSSGVAAVGWAAVGEVADIGLGLA
jgi:hypothetical protein